MIFLLGPTFRVAQSGGSAPANVSEGFFDTRLMLCTNPRLQIPAGRGESCPGAGYPASALEDGGPRSGFTIPGLS